MHEEKQEPSGEVRSSGPAVEGRRHECARCHEEWRPVLGFEGCYEVSSCGRVRSLTRFAGSRTYQGRILAPYPNVAGYLCLRLSKDDRKRSRSVQSLVLEAFVGPRPDGFESRHLDGSRTNNHAPNLVWATRATNMHDQRIHGTVPIGVRNGAAKITPDEVREIRRRFAAGEVRSRLAREYGLHTATLYRIADGKLWPHVH